MIAAILRFIGYRFLNVSLIFDTIHRYPKDEYRRYRHDDPDETLRLTYPLSEDSLIVDVGGNTGDWATPMFCRYRCTIDIYEPHPVLAAICKRNFDRNPKVNLYQEALADSDGKLILYGDGQNSSVFKTGRSYHIVEAKKASKVFNERYPRRIDLLKFNVEGAEYVILPELLENYDMTRIINIQIQFHNHVQGHEQMRKEILTKLSKTHRKTWGYDYIFENWERNQ
jgi:FkbM family methyltransferase